MIRKDDRSKLPTGPPRLASGAHQPLRASSRAYRSMPAYPGALAAFRLGRAKRTAPRETSREQLSVGVWEAEGGSLPPDGAALAPQVEPAFMGPIRR